MRQEEIARQIDEALSLLPTNDMTVQLARRYGLEKEMQSKIDQAVELLQKLRGELKGD